MISVVRKSCYKPLAELETKILTSIDLSITTKSCNNAGSIGLYGSKDDNAIRVLHFKYCLPGY